MQAGLIGARGRSLSPITACDGPFPSEPCRLRCVLSRTGGRAGRTDSPLRRSATAWPSL